MAASDARALELELFGSDLDSDCEDHLPSRPWPGDRDYQDVQLQDGPRSDEISSSWPPAQRIADGLVLVRHFLDEGDQEHFLTRILAEGMTLKTWY